MNAVDLKVLKKFKRLASSRNGLLCCEVSCSRFPDRDGIHDSSRSVLRQGRREYKYR